MFKFTIEKMKKENIWLKKNWKFDYSFVAYKYVQIFGIRFHWWNEY